MNFFVVFEFIACVSIGKRHVVGLFLIGRVRPETLGRGKPRFTCSGASVGCGMAVDFISNRVLIVSWIQRYFLVSNSAFCF